LEARGHSREAGIFHRADRFPAALGHFRFTCCHCQIVQGGFFLVKEPLELEASVKSRIENAGQLCRSQLSIFDVPLSWIVFMETRHKYPAISRESIRVTENAEDKLWV